MNLRSKCKPTTDSRAAFSVPIAGKTDSSFPLKAQAGDRWLIFAVCVFLALAVWAVFGQTLRDKFVNYDDARCVYDNPTINGGLNLRAIGWIFTHENDLDQWLPLTDISHMVDWQLYGSNAGGHHLTNVLLHAANAILLFLTLRKITGALWRSAFVAAVFAVHPLRVESVAWVTERKDVLSGLFFMLTLWSYAGYARNAAARSPEPGVESPSAFQFLGAPRYWLALLFFTLGLLSKSMLVTLPFVLLLLDYWPLNRLSPSVPGAPPRGRLNRWKGLLLEKIPFLLLSAASCVVTVLTQKNAMLALQGVTFPWRVGNALVACVDYLGQMFYPAGLAVLYPHPGNHLSVLRIGLSALVLLLISTGVMAGWRKYPCLPAGWLWYLGMLVPVIGLLQVGEQARADRYTYLPQIGLYIMAAWGVMEICGSWRHHRAVLGAAAAAILAGLMGVAHVQAGYWKDSVSLWMHTLACTTANPAAHSGLGMALADEGKIPEAIRQYEQAIQLKPDFPVAQYNLGIALASQGKLAEAIEHYRKAVQVRPDYAEALNNLGNALGEEGRLPEAVQQFERALQARPDFAEAHFDLGVALARQGKLEEAIPHFRQALALAAAQNNNALAESIRARLQPLLPDLAQPQSP
jgi:tetratricopeptide (TPR) repeat protein